MAKSGSESSLSEDGGLKENGKEKRRKTKKEPDVQTEEKEKDSDEDKEQSPVPVVRRRRSSTRGNPQVCQKSFLQQLKTPVTYVGPDLYIKEDSTNQ